jgi:hypothetical protein
LVTNLEGPTILVGKERSTPLFFLLHLIAANLTPSSLLELDKQNNFDFKLFTEVLVHFNAFLKSLFILVSVFAGNKM